MTAFRRFVAIGDSTTEGLDDPYPDGRGHRGWADRLAERLAAATPDLAYANLAVRGRLTAQIRAEQLPSALALRPDLATVVTGVNDFLRPRFDLAAVAQDIEAMHAALAAQGATVATFTMPDLSRFMPVARLARTRLLGLNDALREICGRTGAILIDLAAVPVAADPRLWSDDRLHANSAGHERIADALAAALDVPGATGDWARPLAAAAARRRIEAVRAEMDWSRRHLLPWVLRRARGRSSGDGVLAKRPELQPLSAGSGREAF